MYSLLKGPSPAPQRMGQDPRAVQICSGSGKGQTQGHSSRDLSAGRELHYACVGWSCMKE